MWVAVVAVAAFMTGGFVKEWMLQRRPVAGFEFIKAPFPEGSVDAGVVEALPLGVVVTDAGGEVILRNAAADALVDSWSDGVVGRLVMERLQTALAGQHHEEQVRSPGGSPRVIELLVRPLLSSGKTVGATAVLVDVTERLRVEALRIDFVANVSHELKTPLGAMSLLAETLSQETDPETVGRLSGHLEAEAQRLGRIVDDLLDLSRVEGQPVDELAVVDLSLVVAEVMERLETLAAGSSVRLATELLPVSVVGDRLQLTSLVRNLVENAIKYSDQGGLVTVLLAPSDEGSEGRLVVTDEGIGIPERELDRVFERFYRVDRARSRQSGGTGLGLSIVRNVVAQHGGTVVLDSVEGSGTTVTVLLPAAHS